MAPNGRNPKFHHTGFLMVRAKGLEPPHLAIPEPKSGASTNSATPAYQLHSVKRVRLYKARAKGKRRYALQYGMLRKGVSLGSKRKFNISNSILVADNDFTCRDFYMPPLLLAIRRPFWNTPTINALLAPVFHSYVVIPPPEDFSSPLNPMICVTSSSRMPSLILS